MTFYLKIAKPNAGLCNQLYALAGCITYVMGRYTKLVIGNFLLDINTQGLLPFGTVVDIEHLSNWCQENCNGLVVEEGQYNTHPYVESPIPFFGGAIDPAIFIGVLKHGIQFKSYIVERVEQELVSKAKPSKNYKNTVIVHLRLEQDVVQHFLEKHEQERVCLSDMQIKYIDLIRLCCNPKEDHLVLLTGDAETDNNAPVLKYLDVNGYSYYLSQTKCFNKREINGIADLILAEKLNCKKVIGLYESSYTYTLIHRCLTNSNVSATVMSYLKGGIKNFDFESSAEYYRSF